jgi:hypothetical protein
MVMVDGRLIWVNLKNTSSRIRVMAKARLNLSKKDIFFFICFHP